MLPLTSRQSYHISDTATELNIYSIYSQYVQLEQQKILRPSNGRLASLTNMAALCALSDVILRHFFMSFC